MENVRSNNRSTFLVKHNARKQLAESLILSNLIIATLYFIIYLHTPSVKCKKYKTQLQVLPWLPITERIELSILKLSHKSLYQTNFPTYLKLELHDQNRKLRLSTETLVKINQTDTTFNEEASKIYYDLPLNIRKLENYNEFVNKVKKIMLDKAIAKYL